MEQKEEMVGVHQSDNVIQNDCRMRTPGDQMHSTAAGADNTALNPERL